MDSFLVRIRTLSQKMWRSGAARWARTHPKSSLAIGLGVVLFLVFYFSFYRPPGDFPVSTIITVERGVGLSYIAGELQDAHIIRSKFWFTNFVIAYGGERTLVAGDYLFDRPENVFEIISRLTTGRFGLSPVRVTVPEGLNTFDIAELFRKKFSKFDENQFLALVRNKEGYLFPDTYFFMPDVRAPEVVAILSKTFQDKILPLADEIATSTHSQNEIITMASILEGEALTLEDRKIISGILWKRIKIGMPLQVDVTFKYVNGKGTAELTTADLKIDSPYNTYKYKGLPPTPISNPGLTSIQAALEPTATKYLYFLSDNDGVTHYAATFAEHVRNKQKYLR